MATMRDKHHAAVLDWQSDLRHGKMNRRTFLRLATLVGVSATMAYALAGCAPMTDMAAPPPKRGGTMKIGTSVQPIGHPALISWAEAANQLRQVGEYLTETGADNLTRPWLLEKWETDEDVKTWTLFLRRGIRFNNGQPLTADDLLFNFQQWLDLNLGSSMLGLLSYLEMNNIEKVDDYTVRLHLNEPQIGVPEHLFHYPALILPRSFEGNFPQQPVGTGPFTLVEYTPGEQAIFKRRQDYWRSGADDKPLPYLDKLIYFDLNPDERVAAMQGGLIDTLYVPRPADWRALRVAPGINIYRASTAQTFVVRMRTDQEPWRDERVRQALKLCQDRQKILDLTYFDQGRLAHDAHVAPIHPAYCKKPIPKYDPQQARELLAAAGYTDGLRVTLTTKNDQSEPVIAQALRELAAPGGFDIVLNIVEPARYRLEWTEVNFGITTWAHRPLGTMTLALAYTADASGRPVPWNETQWVDDTFTQLLRQAERTLDVAARRNTMCQIEDIMQERGPIGISYWRDGWTIMRSEFKNVKAHPTGYDLFYDVWKDA